MKRGPLLLLVASLVLAGCAVKTPDGTTPPGSTEWRSTPGRLLCLDEATPSLCNYEATVNPTTRQANELSTAVNPTDPLNILATGKDYTPEEAGDCVWAGVYTSLDGGLTWTNQNVPGSNWKRLADPSNASEPNEFSRFWCATDPVVAFGPDGTAYWTVMPYQCDRASGSKVGREVVPPGAPVEDQGGFNDWFWTCSGMYVLVSHDKGLTWTEWQEVAFGPRLEHDKQWIATAPNGNVLLCWNRDTNYQAPVGIPEEITPGESGMSCAVSKDKGASWTEPTVLNPDWAGGGPAVDYDAQNVAYAAYLDGSNIAVSRSLDGLNWSRPVKVGPYHDPPAGGEYGWPVVRGSDFRVFALPLIAVDRSNGTYGGSIYVTWFDHSEGEGQIRVSYSRDEGKTWTASPTPHDDDATKMADQFFPAISVGPDGTVDVSWWDRRDDPQNHLFHVYYTYSKDGGRHWARNLRVTDVASDEQYSHHQNGMVFLGDYRDQESSTLGAHLVWVDTRNEKADAFTAIVQR